MALYLFEFTIGDDRDLVLSSLDPDDGEVTTDQIDSNSIAIKLGKHEGLEASMNVVENVLRNAGLKGEFIRRV